MMEFSEEQQKWLMLIGYFNTQWAMAEFAMDVVINAVHNDFGGDKIRVQIPLSFKRKPPYLREAFKANKNISPYYKFLDEHLIEAVKLSQDRNIIVHGTFPDLYSLPSEFASSGYAKLINISRKSPKTHQAKKYTAEKLEALAYRCMLLALNFFCLGADAVGTIPREQYHDIFREIFRENGVPFPLT